MKPYYYKLLSIALSLVMLAALSACTSHDDDPVRPGTEAPRLLTFGFYAADNGGRLADDYVTTVSTTSPARITLTVPPIVDCTSLIARFTTAEGNSVWVNDVEQQNGVTAQDFTLPLDYYVTNGKLWQRYEVTVSRRTTSTWQALPRWEDHTVYSISHIAVSPADGSLYAAFKARKDVTTGEEDLRIHALHLEADDQWRHVGQSLHRAYSSYLGFDIAPSGQAYIAYPNYDLTPYSTCVERVTETGPFETIGADLENAQANYISFVALSDDCLINTMVGNTSATYYRTNATSIYDGRDWQVGLGPCGSLTAYKCTMTRHGDVAYLAVMERATGYVIHIYEYRDKRWTEVPGYQEPTVQNGIAAGAFKLTTDMDGNLYVLTDDNATGAYLIRLRKYDVREKTWSTVSGNSTIIDGHDSHIQACAAIAPNGTPYICYRDIADHSYFKYICLDPETRQWTDPVTISTNPVNGDISMAFTPAGLGYASYVDTDNKLCLFCYGR